MIQRMRYLDRSHADASLAEHARARRRDERLDQPFKRELWRQAKLRTEDLKTIRQPMFTPRLPDVFAGITACFSQWIAVAETCSSESYRNLSTCSLMVETGPNREEEYPGDSARFYRLPDGGLRIVEIDIQNVQEEELELRIIGPKTDAEALAADAETLLNWMKHNRWQKGKVLRGGGRLLKLGDPVTWDDISLPEPARKLILANTVGMLEKRELYRRHGVPLKRGVLLHGEPGTGKTMIGKALAGMNLATFLWVTAADVSDTARMKRLFELARELSPTILFLEDLDLYAGERGENLVGGPALGELLGQMDGLADNDGLIFIATTNDLNAIEPAVRERPSRFDVVLEIGPPDRAGRRQILSRLLQSAEPGEERLDSAADLTAGLTGAQLREIAFLALQRAIDRAPGDHPGPVTLEEEDLKLAVDKLAGLRRGPMGFRRAGES
jgi:hypothetical protein